MLQGVRQRMKLCCTLLLILGQQTKSFVITPLKNGPTGFYLQKSPLNQLKNQRPSSALSLSVIDLVDTSTITISSSFIDSINNQQTAEALAGPFFGLSLLPYLAFLFFLDVPQNETPKGVTVGFATCLLFVFLTIPAAIAAQVNYGVSLADCDWLHGSAESLLTITNLVTVLVRQMSRFVAFRFN